MRRIHRVMSVLGKRSLRMRTNKIRNLTVRFLPHVVNISSVNDISLQNLKIFANSLVKVECATLILETALIVYNLNKKRNFSKKPDKIGENDKIEIDIK